MATRFYLRSTAWSGANNPPVYSNWSTTGQVLASGAISSPKQLSLTKGASQSTITQATAAATSQQTIILGTFVSDPLAATTWEAGVDLGQIVFSGAFSETNLNVNAGLSAAVMLFRPSTGAVIGYFSNGFTSYAVSTSEPSAASTEKTAVTTTAFCVAYTIDHVAGLTALDGDVIVVQLAATSATDPTSGFAQAMGTAYSVSAYYNGTTESTTAGATVSNHAAFLELPMDLAFAGDGPGTVDIAGSASAVASASATGLIAGMKASAAAVASASATTLTPDPNGIRIRCAASAQADLTIKSALVVSRSLRMADALGRYVALGSDGADRVIFAFNGSKTYADGSGVDGRNKMSSIGGTYYVSSDAAASAVTTGVTASGNAEAAIRSDGTAVMSWGLNWESRASPYTSTLASGTFSTSAGVLLWMAVEGTRVVAAHSYTSGGTKYNMRVTTNATSWSAPSVDVSGNTPACLAVAGSNGVMPLSSGSFDSFAYGDPATSSALSYSSITAFYAMSPPVKVGSTYYSVSRTNRRVYSSADGVTGWTLMGTVPGTGSWIELHATGGINALVAKTDTEFFYVSRDGGASWEMRGGMGFNAFKVTGGLITQGEVNASGFNTNNGIWHLAFSVLDMATNPPIAMGAVRVSASATLTSAAASSPFMDASAVAAATGTANLLTAHGTKLYMDGPRLCVTTATAVLGEGPVQWFARLAVRPDTVGSGAKIARGLNALPPYSVDPVVHSRLTTLASGRWLNLDNGAFDGGNALRYSDDYGTNWRDTGERLSAASSARWIAGSSTRLVLSNGRHSGDNGKTWANPTWPFGTRDITSEVAYGGGKFVCFAQGSGVDVSHYDGRWMYSSDGITWTSGGTFSDEISAGYNGMRLDGPIFWMAGLSKFVALVRIQYHDITAPVRYATYHSADGLSWTRDTVGTTPLYVGGVEASDSVIVATDGSYSTNGGASWSAMADPLPPGDYIRQLGNVFFMLETSDFDMPRRTLAWRSTDGSHWEQTLIGDRYDLPGPEGMLVPGRTLSPNGPIVIGAVIGPNYAPTWTTSLEITRATVLTATGVQPMQLRGDVFGGGAATGTLRDRPVHALAGAAVAVSAATAPLTDANPWQRNLLVVASATGALTTGIALAARLASRAKPQGSDIGAVADFYTAGNVAVAPATGLAVTPSFYRSLSTLQWTAAVKPDGTNTPSALASDGQGTVCAFMPNTSTYATSNGSTWLSGTAMTAPPGGWGSALYARLLGGGGKFVLFVGTAGAWYSWVSTNGRSWTGPTQIHADAGVTMDFAATADGFYGMETPSSGGQTKFFFSADGSQWASRLVPITVDTAAGLNVSAGALAVKQSGVSKTTFFDARQIFSGAALNSVTYPDADGAVPGDFFIADAHSSRPRFYRVSGGGVYSRLNEPLQLTGHTYETSVWTLPAGHTATGDMVVSDGSLYARSVRTSDSANVGITANMGVPLTDWVPPPGAMYAAVSAGATAQASLTTSIRMSAAVGAAAAASAVGMGNSNNALAATAAAAPVVSASLSTQVVLAGALTSVSAASVTTLIAGARFDAEVVCSAIAAADLNTRILLEAHATCAAFIAGVLRREMPPGLLEDQLVCTGVPFTLIAHLGSEGLTSSAGRAAPISTSTDESPLWAASSDSPALPVSYPEPETFTKEPA